MPSYYDVLKVSPRASKAEIRSAYRRLARRLHPDSNRGSVDTVREFRKIAQAYEVLGDPQRRAEYDHERLKVEFNQTGSLFKSDNSHAQRIRRMVYEKRYKEIVNRMHADERTEAAAVGKWVVPFFAFVAAAFLSAAVNPALFTEAGFMGRLLILTLAAAGTVHVIGRARETVDRYSYPEQGASETLRDEGPDGGGGLSVPLAGAAILAGVGLSLWGGFLLGSFLGLEFPGVSSGVSPREFQVEILLYPPIAAFVVDLLLSVAIQAGWNKA